MTDYTIIQAAEAAYNMVITHSKLPNKALKACLSLEALDDKINGRGQMITWAPIPSDGAGTAPCRVVLLRLNKAPGRAAEYCVTFQNCEDGGCFQGAYPEADWERALYLFGEYLTKHYHYKAVRQDMSADTPSELEIAHRAVAGLIGVGAVNGVFFDEDQRNWASAKLKGDINVPIAYVNHVIGRETTIVIDRSGSTSRKVG